MGDKSKLYSPATVEIMKYLNVDNAKGCACLMVIGFVLYHGLLHARYGGDSCHWLLSEGRFQGDNIWQPFGCMVHKYTKSEVCNCMHYISYWGGNNHIVFLGDSRMRQQYQSFISLVSGENYANNEKQHADMSFTDRNINLQVDFLWQPIMNESYLQIYEKWLKQPEKKRPSTIITGSGTWYMKFFNGTNEGLNTYKENLTNLKPVIDKVGSHTKVIWILQQSVDEKKCQNYSRNFLTNKQIDNYNEVAEDILGDSSVWIWRSSKIIANHLSHDTIDGLHSGPVTLSWDSQILVNFHCNDHLNFDDGTCCSSREPVTPLQIITCAIFAMCLILAFVLYMWRKLKSITLHTRKREQLSGVEEGLLSASCDRNTNGSSSQSLNVSIEENLSYNNEDCEYELPHEHLNKEVHRQRNIKRFYKNDENLSCSEGSDIEENSTENMKNNLHLTKKKKVPTATLR